VHPPWITCKPSQHDMWMTPRAIFISYVSRLLTVVALPISWYRTKVYFRILAHHIALKCTIVHGSVERAIPNMQHITELRAILCSLVLKLYSHVLKNPFASSRQPRTKWALDRPLPHFPSSLWHTEQIKIGREMRGEALSRRGRRWWIGWPRALKVRLRMDPPCVTCVTWRLAY
jgi:hypothetical protein